MTNTDRTTQFVTMLMDAPTTECHHFSTRSEVDGMKCRVNVSKRSDELCERHGMTPYVVSVQVSPLCDSCGNKRDIHCVKNVTRPVEVVTTLKKVLSTYKIVNDELCSEEEMSRHLIFYNTVLDIKGKEEEECYVCNENTRGFKTDCGHNICVQCFSKSTTKGTFRCGICRQVEHCRCEEEH